MDFNENVPRRNSAVKGVSFYGNGESVEYISRRIEATAITLALTTKARLFDSFIR